MHIIILSWGMTGIMGKLIHLSYYQIVFYRVFFAGVSLLIYLRVKKRQIVINNKKDWLKVIGVGILVTAHWLTFFKAIQMSTASVGVICLATTTLHVSWIEPIVLKKRFSWIEFILGILIIFGILSMSDTIRSDQLGGVLWGLISAVFAALFSVFNLRLRREGIPSTSITLIEMFSGAIIVFLFLGVQGKINTNFFTMTINDFVGLLFLSVICTTIAFVLMIDISNKIGAFATSLSINLEPIYSVLLAVIILHENTILGADFYWGALYIVVLVMLNPILKKYLLNKKNRKFKRRFLS